MFRWKIFYLHFKSSSASRKWKNSTLSVLLTLYTVHRVRRDPSVTVRNFSPDNTGHRSSNNWTPGSLIFFHIFLWKIPISIGNILSSLRILKRFQKVKKFERCPFCWLCSQSTKRLWLKVGRVRGTGTWDSGTWVWDVGLGRGTRPWDSDVGLGRGTRTWDSDVGLGDVGREDSGTRGDSGTW